MNVPSTPSKNLWLLRIISFPNWMRLGFGPIIALVILLIIIIVTLAAPYIATHDPLQINAMARLQPPSKEHFLGTDNYGRDLFSRMILGGRISLVIGIFAALFSVVVGIVFGLLAGFFRVADGFIMRAMDALMAMPSILIAIALVALNGPSIASVIIAITVPEVPRMVRLVRSVVLTAREEPYIEAATTLGSSTSKILFQHLLPNTIPPIIVQGTYVLASAILLEAILSFLGAGISTEIPTWGNVMAEGRVFFRIKPSLILWPGLMLALCVLSINLLGDTARDNLDPRQKKRES